MRLIGMSAFIAALTAAVPILAFAGEPAATAPAVTPDRVWGAADVQPTPEHPVYFRWSQGCFPGATPPLEWWEGTPTTRKVTGVFGNPPRRGEIDALDFADQKSKNILWKVPVPVGNKLLIQTPAFLYCMGLREGSGPQAGDPRCR